MQANLHAFFISISFSRPTILYIFAPKKKREEAN